MLFVRSAIRWPDGPDGKPPDLVTVCAVTYVKPFRGNGVAPTAGKEGGNVTEHEPRPAFRELFWEARGMLHGSQQKCSDPWRRPVPNLWSRHQYPPSAEATNPVYWVGVR